MIQTRWNGLQFVMDGSVLTVHQLPPQVYTVSVIPKWSINNRVLRFKCGTLERVHTKWLDLIAW